MSDIARAQMAAAMRTRAFWQGFLIFVLIFTVLIEGWIWFCNAMLVGIDPTWAFAIRFVIASAIACTIFFLFVRRVLHPLARKQNVDRSDGAPGI